MARKQLASRFCQRRNPQDSGPLLGCPLGNLVSISANTLMLALLCWLHKNRMFGQTADEESLKDTSGRRVMSTNLQHHHRYNIVAPAETCTVSAFFPSRVFTCQSDFDAGPVPPSPRIRHHSGKNDHTNFSLESPKNAVSPLSGETNKFGTKSCGLFLFSSRVKMYYFIAKSCAPSKSNNTGEHFRAGSGTY